VKNRKQLAIDEMQDSQKLGVNKITLKDLDEPKLGNVAGGCSVQPTTTVQPTHQVSCLPICAGVR
jgi:hypothetical protein